MRKHLVARAWNKCFRRTQFEVYQLYDSVSVPANAFLDWLGINRLAADADVKWLPDLAPEYDRMRLCGDAGLLARVPSGDVAGWVWVRTGPYVEHAGVGCVFIPAGFRVVRYLEVRTAWQRQGVGQALLAELVRRLDRQEAVTTIALVAPNNLPSIRCFATAGFCHVGSLHTRRLFGLPLTGALRISAARLR